MRVLHVTPTFFDAQRSLVGGGERFVSELARAMADSVETEILTFGRERETIDREGVRITVRRPWFRGRHTLEFLAGRMPEIEDVDVIHLHQPYTLMGTEAILKAARHRRPVFLTDLGGGSINFHQRLGLAKRVAGHLSISQFAANSLPADGVPRHIIYAGVDTRKFRPRGGTRERRVVCVGRIMPHKGQADVIRAIPMDVPLDIYGPVLDAKYFAHCRSLAAGKQVRFVHDASTEAIAEAYASAWLTVQASVVHTEFGGVSQNTELFGLTLAESMACETPVIATRAGAMPEVVEEGSTGLVVPPSDPEAMRAAMLSILDDSARAREMGRRGRERVLSRFTWDAVSRRCLDAYSNHHPRPTPNR